MSKDNMTGQVSLHIDGDVSGQIAIGDNILQIGDVHGGVVNIIQPDKKPSFKPRRRPVMIRPRKLPDFLNRESEISVVMEAMNDGEPVSMYAENGMGKTALLRKLAYDAPGDNFPDGILYMPAHITCVEDLLQIIFDQFYESDSPALPTLAELRGLLQKLEALIMLDDVLLSREDVTELLNSLPRSVIVLASSERCLWGEGCCMELSGLPLNETLTLIETELERQLAPSEQSFVEALYQLGTGQPLLMIQAAALVREGKSFEEIVAALKVPGEEPAHILAERLNETQNRILRFLDAFQELAVPKKHLAGLTRAKELESELHLLKKLRFVRESGSAISLAGPLIIPLGPLAQMDCERESLDYFVSWLQEAPSLLEVRESLDLILFLLGQAVNTGRWDAVIALGKGIERALILGGLWSTWSQVLGWILEAACSLSDKTLQAWTLHQLGTRSLCLGDLSAAQSSFTQALALREALGNQAASALTRRALGTATAPPTTPIHVPAPQPSLASWGALAPVVKVALLVAGTAVAATAIVMSNSPPPAPPTAVPSVSTKEPLVAPVPPQTETPAPTGTPEPTSTIANTSTPAPLECVYDLHLHGAADLGSIVQISFDPAFDYSDDDLKNNLTIFKNTTQVSIFDSFSLSSDENKRLYVQLRDLNLNDEVQIELLVDGVLHCSEVKSVYFERYATPTKVKEETCEQTTFCTWGWNASLCCCCSGTLCTACQ